MLHALALAIIASFAARPPVPAKRKRPSMTMFVVAPSEDAEFPGLKPVDRSRTDWIVDGVDADAAFTIEGVRFAYARVATHATLLFPFLTPGLSLEHFAVTPERSPIETFRYPVDTPAGRTERETVRRPLALSDREMQALVDQSWSRRDRWTPFQRIEQYAERYDSNAGRLPALLRAYADQDGLQLYADGAVPDQRLWAQLGLAADHVNFIGFIRQYTSQHAGTKAATELLFLLDQLVQGSLDALLTLIAMDPARDLRATRDADERAYALLDRVRDYYADQLERLRLTSLDAATTRFEAVRLEILSRIVRTTPHGYRAGDAGYLMGAILWKQRRTRDAVIAWSAIRPDPSDTYVGAYSEIRSALQSAAVADADPANKALATRIGRILAREHGRWVDASYERLRHFGYHFNTF